MKVSKLATVFVYTLWIGGYNSYLFRSFPERVGNCEILAALDVVRGHCMEWQKEVWCSCVFEVLGYVWPFVFRSCSSHIPSNRS
jgi:hypothetical protein